MRLATMQGRQAAAEPHHPIGFSNMILFGKKYRKKLEKSIAKKYFLEKVSQKNRKKYRKKIPFIF